jgi:hypothetical protein
MFGWFRRYIRRISIFGVEVEFHPPTEPPKADTPPPTAPLPATTPSPQSIAAQQPVGSASPKEQPVSGRTQTAAEQGAGWAINDPKGQGTAFFKKVYELAQRVAPQLRMADPKKKSPAGWIMLMSALERASSFKADIHIKQDKGYADLHLTGWAAQIGRVREVLGPTLDPGLSIETAGQSAAIRVMVPMFWGDRPFEGQEEAIAEALRRTVRLQEWYRKNLPTLERLGEELAAKK